MVKRSLGTDLPAGVPKRPRQGYDEDSKWLKAATQTDHAALRRVQDFLGAAGISCAPGVLRDTTNGQILPQVPAQAWLAFAELNTLLQQHQHLLKEVTLRSYHSFTREAKGVVLQRVIAADPAVARNVLGAGCGALFARAPPPQQPILLSQLPLHLQMTAHILEASFRGFRDASVVRYTFAGCPSWLAQWCERWNLGVSNDMTLLAVNAYTAEIDCIHVSGGEAISQSTSPAATVFVPVVTQ